MSCPSTDFRALACCCSRSQGPAHSYSWSVNSHSSFCFPGLEPEVCPSHAGTLRQPYKVQRPVAFADLLLKKTIGAKEESGFTEESTKNPIVFQPPSQAFPGDPVSVDSETLKFSRLGLYSLLLRLLTQSPSSQVWNERARENTTAVVQNPTLQMRILRSK